VREIPRRFPVDEATFGQLKARANANAAAHLPGGTTSTQSAPPALFDGLGLQDAGGWNPPDGGLAVSQTAVLEAVNEAFALYNTTGGAPAAGPTGLPALFGTADSVFDPRALYDKSSGRFVLLAVTSNPSTRTASYTLAVSTTSSATTTWCTYKLDATTGSGGSRAWPDFPGLGMDGDNLYITSNQFAFGSNRFQFARVVVVPKSSVYASGCGIATSTAFNTLRNPDGSTSFTVQPSDWPDAPPGTTSMYLVNALWSSGSNLVLRSITKTASGALQLSPSSFISAGAGSIATYTLPADAPQQGGNPIDSGDTRLGGATYRYGAIYTSNTTQTVDTARLSNTVGTANAAASVYWYRIVPGASNSYTGQTFAITDPNIAYFFPRVLAGCTGTATASACSSGVFAGLEVSGSGSAQGGSAYTVRDAGPPRLYQAGATGYTLNTRWGDYPAVSADPGNAATVWVLGEYAKASGAWGTAVNTVP
jgi:hypothetical protein